MVQKTPASISQSWVSLVLNFRLLATQILIGWIIAVTPRSHRHTIAAISVLMAAIDYDEASK